MSELKTCFKRVDYDLSGLLHYIDIGDIGLLDIQRPFVWSNAKVRDLFDSMYRGFPPSGWPALLASKFAERLFSRRNASVYLWWLRLNHELVSVFASAWSHRTYGGYK